MSRQLWVKMMMIAIVIMLMCGCWDRRELNDLAVAMGLGIDKWEDGYEITVQIVNPTRASSKEASTVGAPVVLYTSRSTSIFEAFRLLTREMPRKAYFSHLQLLVISEEVAKEGISGIVDVLVRNYEFRPSFYIALAQNGRAREVLGIPTAIDVIPSNEQRKSLEESEAVWAATVKTTYDQLVNEMSQEGVQTVITGVRILGSRDSDHVELNHIDLPGRLQYSQMAAFDGDKFVGWLGMDASKAFNYIRGNVRNTIGKLTCGDGGHFSVEVVNDPQVKIKSELRDSKPYLRVDIYLETSIAEYDCDIPFTDEGISRMERMTAENLEHLLNMGISEVQQEHKVDVFGFGRIFEMEHADYWRAHSQSWKEIFPSLEVAITASARIVNFGSITNKVDN